MEKLFNINFKPFPTDRVCNFKNSEIFHFDHPSCCRSKEFALWRENYLKPMFDWEIQNPLPDFKRQLKCDLSINTHKDNKTCCNLEVVKSYNSFLSNSFKLLPLVYINDLTYKQLVKMDRTGLRIPLPHY